MLKCCTQYISKFGKFSRGHKTGKSQFSFQSQRRAMSKINTIALISHASKVMIKILQASLWQHRNQELSNIKIALRRGDKNTQKNYTKDFRDLVNHDDVVTHLEPDILDCEVKWALGSITRNKASGGDRISAALFKILKDDDVKVLHPICQHIWKT